MSSQPMIDDRTAGIVRSAMAEARAGRVAEAFDIAKEGIAKGADEGVLSAMLGAIHCQTGNFRAAVEPLSKAAELRPDDPSIRFELVGALLRTEQYGEVVQTLTDEVVDADSSMNFLRQRAFAAHMDGQLDLAFVDYRRFLAANPDDWESWNNLGNAYLIAADLPSAVESLRNAARINPQAAPTRLNLARALRDSGDLESAEIELRSMARDFPNDKLAVVDLYHVLRALGRPQSDMEEALEEASKRDPGNVELLIELGDLQTQHLCYDKSEKTYRRALSQSPSNAAAFLGLARTLEHSRPEDLGAVVAESEEANLDDEGRLNIIRAFGARRAKQYSEGLAALERVPDDFESVVRWHLAGEMLEAVGRYDEAFEAFVAMNRAHAMNESEPERRAEELRDKLREQLKRTSVKWRRTWTAPPVASERPAPIFLVGFPRSGTTLLDTILMGHPDVAVLEEQPLLQAVGLGLAGFESLAGLDESEVRRRQDQYFELAAERVTIGEETLLIDKAPLHLHRVPQIMRLFPDARFIFALRHPADAVFGCFKASFRLNNSMSNFLSLETSAEFYDLTFQMWERSLALFSPEVHTVRYEEMVESPEATLRPVVEGLGLDWNDRILDHQKTAQDRGLVATASYAQVTEPIYRHAAGRWRHYEKHLEPILPVLEPWATKFGYTL
jgi:cytochrome c-type biogenesis protein CcmH/NrfG